jgi:hypothetical protein
MEPFKKEAVQRHVTLDCTTSNKDFFGALLTNHNYTLHLFMPYAYFRFCAIWTPATGLHFAWM